jgi:8-oxo-dGTP pyrophosphatase MutT (NUDIX family)
LGWSSAIKSLLHEIAKPDFHAGILLWAGNFAALKKAFWKYFTIVKAGGGRIFNETGAVLLIFRRGMWDLPKGKLDPGETIEQCAIREVREETGIPATLGGFLLTTYHYYNDYGHEVLKETCWYHMQAPAAVVLTPQTEEDIAEIRWVAPKDLPTYLPGAFPSVRDVLKA